MIRYRLILHTGCIAEKVGFISFVERVDVGYILDSRVAITSIFRSDTNCLLHLLFLNTKRKKEFVLGGVILQRLV